MRAARSGHIMSEGMTQDGDTFTFKEVNIEGNGWLVLLSTNNVYPPLALQHKS